MDQKLNQLKDTYKQEDSLRFSEADAEQVYQKISDKKQSKNNVFHPFRIALALAATFLVGFLLLTNLDGIQQGESQTQPTRSIEGYVIEILDDEALVTNSKTEKSIRYHNIPNDLNVGQKIKSWHSSQASSNPSTTELEEYEINNNNAVKGSKLTEAEALNIAIQKGILDANPPLESLLFVNNVNFNAEEKLWEVQIKDGLHGTIIHLVVNDLTASLATSDDLNNYEFNYNEYGEQFDELEQDITDAITEQGTILNRIAKANEEQGKGLLNGAAIDENGTVTIDFQPFEMSLATAEIGKLSNEIKDLAFNYDEANEIFIQFNGNRKAAYDHLGVEVAPLTRDVEARHQFVDVLNEYEAKFRYLVDHNTDGKLEFNSISKVKEFLSQTMSQELAEDHIESLIRERDDGIYLLATFSPIFINLKKSHEINEIDQSTYHIVQEQNTELRGHLEVTFVIKNVDNEWIINDVKVKDLEN